MSVKIRDIEETTALLYGPADELVGEIKSLLQLNDIRIQIKESNLSGYYIKWGDEIIMIDKNSNLECWPPGFFDTLDNQLNKLLDWADNDNS